MVILVFTSHDWKYMYMKIHVLETCKFIIFNIKSSFYAIIEHKMGYMHVQHPFRYLITFMTLYITVLTKTIGLLV